MVKNEKERQGVTTYGDYEGAMIQMTTIKSGGASANMRAKQRENR